MRQKALDSTFGITHSHTIHLKPMIHLNKTNIIITAHTQDISIHVYTIYIYQHNKLHAVLSFYISLGGRKKVCCVCYNKKTKKNTALNMS